MPGAADLVSQGYTGYQGWGDAEANADFAKTGGSGKGGPTSSSGGGTASGSAPQIAQIWNDPAKLNDYLTNYQNGVFASLGNSDTPTAKPSYTPEELTAALQSKAGMTPEQATAAATGSNKDALATQYLGYKVPGTSGQGQSYSAITSSLTPNTDMPAPLDRVALFDSYRQAYGVSGLETNLNDLKSQQAELDAQNRTNQTTERGKPVAQNVIEGRVTEEQRTYQENSDFVGRQITRVTDQLNTSYNVIGMYMNFQNLDYQDAVNRYNQEFTQNMQIFDMLKGVRQEGMAELKQQTDVQFQQADLNLKYQDSARANLQIMANAIMSGNLNPSSLSADQKTSLNKLEVQAGLPMGFVQNLGLSNKEKILFTNSNNGITQVGIQNADGTVSVKSYGTATGGSSGKPGSAQFTASLNSQVESLVRPSNGQPGLAGADGFVSGSAFKTLMGDYIGAGGTGTDFINNFAQLTNPNNTDFSSQYGFSLSKRDSIASSVQTAQDKANNAAANY